ncbi:MAG TPA: hypothetical protein VL424_21910 [Pararobbsia sp.]|nr:hypothetical protein [Pararobbsia sp.]
MQTTEQHYAPGQCQTVRLQRASVIVAVDGPLRIEYRDESLSWLSMHIEPVLVVLGESQSHELPYGAWVNISAEGPRLVTGLIMNAPTWSMRLMAVFRRVRFWGSNASAPHAITSLSITGRPRRRG